MRRMQRGWIWAIFFAAFAAAGCGSAYTYRPIGSGGKKSPTWSVMIKDVRFEWDGVSSSTEAAAVSCAVKIKNDSKEDAAIMGATLTSQGKTLEAKITGDDASRTVTAGASGTITLNWDLAAGGGTAATLLGPNVNWVWTVRIGASTHTIPVSMARE